MATVAMHDLRRSDLRSNVLENPYWITSKEINIEAEDKAAVLFSFPAVAIAGSISPCFYGNKVILLHMMAVELITAITGTTPQLTIGYGTLVDDTKVDLVTTVQVDEYFPDADITEATPAMYFPASGDYYTILGLQSFTAFAKIIPHATVPVIAAYLDDGTSITGGAARLHVLLSEIPAVA